MEPLWCNVAALAVALLYLAWKNYHEVVSRRQRILRERVAYMLWVTAQRVDRPVDEPAGAR
jgi:hypothetical protein